jgi:predicted nuclease of predicted toxin-antitoxin system
MKLLLDENISFRVLKSLAPLFPESIHISAEGGKVKEDLAIFEYARANSFAILTFDEDFYDIQLLKGYPPKIIWLRFGNSSNLKVTSKLIESQSAILSFLSNSESGILEIY